MNFPVLYNAGNLWTGWGTVRFARKNLLRGVGWLVSGWWVLKKEQNVTDNCRYEI